MLATRPHDSVAGRHVPHTRQLITARARQRTRAPPARHIRAKVRWQKGDGGGSAMRESRARKQQAACLLGDSRRSGELKTREKPAVWAYPGSSDEFWTCRKRRSRPRHSSELDELILRESCRPDLECDLQFSCACLLFFGTPLSHPCVSCLLVPSPPGLTNLGHPLFVYASTR